MTRLNQLASAGALLALAACSQQPDAPSPAAVAEIKGKPIVQTASTTTRADQLPLPQGEGRGEGPPPQSAIPNPQSPIPPQSSPAPAAELIDGYAKVGFDKLSAFNYIMPDDISETNKPPVDQFPPAIKSLNEKPIALRGFMLPLKIDQGLVTEMLIMKDQSMCCFGSTPKINEWVSVKMAEKGVKPVMDQPVTVFGKLKVGEMRENGYLVGIYEMAGDKMEAE